MTPPRTISRFPIRHGRHDSRDDGMCAMEHVAWLAGEEHSDEPSCVCPVLGRLVRAANDAMRDDRQRGRYLRPLLPRLVNSRGDAALARRRAWLALDCATRFFAALTLMRTGLTDAAERARATAAVEDPATARGALARIAADPGTATRLRALAWTLARAADGTEPERWIAGVAHAARDADAWPGLCRLVLDMIACDRASPTRPL